MKRRLSPVFWVTTSLLAGVFFGVLMPAAYSLQPGYDYSQVVATAGDTAITRGEVAEHLLFRYGTKTLDNELRREAIIKEEARREGIEVSDAEVDKRIENYKLLLNQYAGLAQLVGSKLALDALPEWMMKDQFRTAMLAEKLMGIEFTPEEMTKKQHEMYTEYMDSFTKPAMANLTVIICTDAQTANDLYKKLQAGEDPGKLSAKYSAFKSIRDIQGKIGWIPRSQISPDAAAKIFGDPRAKDVKARKGLKAREFTNGIEYEWPAAEDERTGATETDYVIFYLNDNIVPASNVPEKNVEPVLDLLVRINEVNEAQDKWFDTNEQRIPWQRVENMANPPGKLGAGYDYSQVVATAGETAITRGEVAERLLFRFGTKMLDTELRREAIIKEEARREEIAVSEAEIDKRIEDYKLLLTQYTDLAKLVGSKEALDALPEWMMKDQFRMAMLTEKLMDIEFTPEEMQKKRHEMYAQYMDTFSKPALANLTMIICTDAQTAVNLYKRLKGGEDPGKLSEKYSAFKSVRDIQGKIGWIPRSQMSPDAAAAIFDVRRGKGLKAKEFTDVIEYEWSVDEGRKDVNDDKPATGRHSVVETDYVIFYLNDDIVPASSVPEKAVEPVLDLLVRINEVDEKQDAWFDKYEKRIPWQRVENMANPQGKLVPIQVKSQNLGLKD